jgi:hypothetical protein
MRGYKLLNELGVGSKGHRARPPVFKSAQCWSARQGLAARDDLADRVVPQLLGVIEILPARTQPNHSLP